MDCLECQVKTVAFSDCVLVTFEASCVDLDVEELRVVLALFVDYE